MKKWIPYMVAAGMVLGLMSYWFHTRTYSAAEVMQMLPPDRALHIFLDVDMLRSGGILDQIAGSPTVESEEYRAFVEGTGVNYRTDLDAVAIAFRDGDRYIALQGRFDWDKIESYARANGGTCIDSQCQMAASSELPNHTLTFYMPRGDVLAFATAVNETANSMIAPGTWENAPDISSDVALWGSAPPYVFTDLEDLPDGTRSFISPLADASGTIFTLGPSADLKSFVLRLKVEWPSEAAAAKTTAELNEVTDLLGKMISRENMTPNPADMSGVLTSGSFASSGTLMTAEWPIDPAFIDTLLGDAGTGGN